MPYKVYSGPRGSELTSPLDKEHLLFKQVGSLDEAFAWARHLESTDRVAVLIEGDDGTSLDKRQIAAAVRQPAR
jgi:hypothetical protein